MVMNSYTDTNEQIVFVLLFIKVNGSKLKLLVSVKLVTLLF